VQAGLITAIYAGFTAAIFGGSNFQVSGPTGAMTVVLVPIVSHFGIASLMPLGLVAGALVIIMGLTHCGALINKVPWPVMEGFTLGIAFAARNIPGSNTIKTAWRTLRSAVQLGAIILHHV
jgi:SulP family sulfate permease